MNGKRKKARPNKEPNVLEKVYEALSTGNYRDTRHSTQRAVERSISLPDVIEVLEAGYHEKSKDEYRADFQSWNYAIRGTTSDNEEFRIAVYFEDDLVMIATVIRL